MSLLRFSCSLLALLAILGTAAAEESAPATKAASSASRPVASVPKSAASDAKDKPAAAANDKLTLDTTVVTGNRELPKVLYIVPWKKAELGQLPGEPFNSLLDEALTPVDREVFRREVQYYGVIAGKDQPQASGAGDNGK